MLAFKFTFPAAFFYLYVQTLLIAMDINISAVFYVK
jgi:hypothetical protein